MELRDLVSDEDFNGLPQEEKAKVIDSLAKGDVDFQSLPQNEQLRVIDSLIQNTPLGAEVKEQSFGNLLKQGLAETLALYKGILGAYGRAASPQFQGMPGVPDGAPAPAKEGEIEQAFSDQFRETQQNIEQLVGAEKTAPPVGIDNKMYENAVKTLSDPLTWLGKGPINIAKNVLGSFVVSASSTAAGELGAEAEKSVFGTEGQVGRVLGTVGGVVSPAALGAIGQKGVVEPVKNIWSKYNGIGTDAVEMEKSLSTGAAKRILQRAAKEQGIEDIDAFVDDFNSIGQKINKQNVPLFVALADNPAIRSQFILNMKSDPDFRAQVNKQLEALSVDIDKNADKIFGARFSPVPEGASVSIKNVKNRISAIDNKLEDLTFKVTPGMSQESLGKSISNLVDAKKKLVKTELSPLYTNLINEAKDKKIVLPKEAVQDIHSFVIQNQIRDIFGKGTELDSKIMSVLSPTTTSRRVPGLDETMQPRVVKDVFYNDLPFEQLDSLKRNINSIQRQKLSGEQLRKINQLEDVVDNARAKLPGNFNQRLMDIDKQYYEKLGVPFNVANINDIDAKKYAEQVAPVVIKNGSGLRQFISAVGEDGYPIAKNAVIADLYKYAVKDGKLNVRALTKYVKDKSEVINQIPGLKEDMQSLVFDHHKLFSAKANLDDAYKVQQKKLADSFLNQQTGNLDFTSLTNNMVNNRSTVSKLIDVDLKNVSPETKKAVLNNVRRELVDKAYSSGQGLKFFTDPRNQFLISKVFGKGYSNQIKQIAKVSDNVALLNAKNISDVISKDEMDAIGAYARELGLPGLDLPYIASTWRDRISSTTQKAIRLLSRVNTGRVNQATKAQIQELLLDPDGLAKFNQVAMGTNFRVKNPVSMRKLLEAFGERVPLYTYQAGKTLDDEQPAESNLPDEFIGGEYY